MKNFNINVIALAVSFAFSAGAMAHNMTEKDSNPVGVKSDNGNCVLLTGNLYDICFAKTNRSEKPAMGELNDHQAGKTDNQERAAKKERCGDEMDGNEKVVCMKGAKMADTAATAGGKPAQTHGGANDAFQACAKNMQATIAAFHARFFQHQHVNAGTTL